MDEIRRSLANRRVFITGHTGFKGSWLALWLHHLGARIYGYSLKPPTEPNNFTVSAIAELLADHREGDIRDNDKLKSALTAAQPDLIFHLAAQPLVRESYLSPRETFEVNVIGIASLLDCVRALGRPCTVIIVTSDKCYENREQIWGYREIDRMGGADPYSASKGAAELLVNSYRKSFFPPEQIERHGVKLASVRAGNVIGGGDWAKDRIVTDIVSAIVERRPVPVRNPQAVRPWQYVLEPLHGYLTLAARMLTSDDAELYSGWNFGPRSGEEATVGRLVELFCRQWGDARWQDCSSPDNPREAAVLRLNIDKAIWRLGWRPRWDLNAAVARTADWYRNYYEGDRAMRAHCLNDIAAYEE